MKIRKPGMGEYQDLTGSVNIEMRDGGTVGINENFKGLCQKLGIDVTKYTPVALDISATEYSPNEPHLSIFAKKDDSGSVTEFRFDSFPLKELLSFMRGFHILASPHYDKLDNYHITDTIEL